MIIPTNNSAFKCQQEISAVTPPLMNVHHALVDCGVNSRDQFKGETVAESISEEFFADIFYLMMEISWVSVEDSFVHFSRFTVENERLKISHQKRHHTKAMNKWSIIHLMMGRDLQFMTMFFMDQFQKFINPFNTVGNYKKDLLNQSLKPKPYTFLDTILWD